MTITHAPAPQPSGGRLLPPSDAAAARASAHYKRAEYLQSVNSGLLTIHEVITAASQPENNALLRIKVRQLLMAQPDWGKVRTANTMTRLATLLGVTEPPSDVTLAWLMDPRAAGTRLIAFADATSTTGDRPPWRGYPFTPPPQVSAKGSRQ